MKRNKFSEEYLEKIVRCPVCNRRVRQGDMISSIYMCGECYEVKNKMIDKTFETTEQGIEKLKEGVSLRNRMCGAMYWNAINDDCFEMAERLLYMGAEKQDLEKILNS